MTITPTPADIIDAPQVAINDIGSADDFLAAIDATIKYFNDGDIVDGTIVKVDRDEVLLDIAGTVPVGRQVAVVTLDLGGRLAVELGGFGVGEDDPVLVSSA